MDSVKLWIYGCSYRWNIGVGGGLILSGVSKYGTNESNGNNNVVL
jgi:hypothetical protein